MTNVRAEADRYCGPSTFDLRTSTSGPSSSPTGVKMRLRALAGTPSRRVAITSVASSTCVRYRSARRRAYTTITRPWPSPDRAPSELP